MLQNTCTVCGGVLQKTADDTAVCMNCRQTYLITSYHIHTPFDWKTHNRRVRSVIPFALLGMFYAHIGAPLPTLALALLIIWQCIRLTKHIPPEPAADGAVPVPRGEALSTRADYIRALRTMPLATMPLGTYGERAAQQIERMEKKEQALKTVLEDNHPFFAQTAEADAYILANCKQIIFRLKHCDQSDPQLCRMHAAFLQGLIEENDKILRDYEALLIEVTQMHSALPPDTPSLDVLADALHSVRTGGQPEEPQINTMNIQQ